MGYSEGVTADFDAIGAALQANFRQALLEVAAECGGPEVAQTVGVLAGEDGWGDPLALEHLGNLDPSAPERVFARFQAIGAERRRQESASKISRVLFQ